jgi:hypothetical protein
MEHPRHEAGGHQQPDRDHRSCVSALALIVSGLLVFWQNRLQARLTAIEEERRGEEVEARRHARVTLSIPQPRIGKGDLVLTNEGPAGAWSVTFEVSSAVEGKQPPFISGLDQLAVDLRPGQSMHFDTAVAMGDAELINAQVRWIDDAGAQEATYTLRTL